MPARLTRALPRLYGERLPLHKRQLPDHVRNRWLLRRHTARRPRRRAVPGGDMKRVLVALFTGLTFIAATLSARAQDFYPSRPVKIMIAFPVGGLLDTVSRTVGEKLSTVLGQQ